VQSQERCKDLLEGLAAKKECTEEEQKVACFYATAMDEETIEKSGIEPMKPLFTVIDDIVDAFKNKDMETYAALLGKLDREFGISPFFGISASPDAKNSDHSIVQVSQGGLGMPDRDYYFDEDKEDKREAYKKHIANMLTLLEDPSGKAEPSEDAAAMAQKIFDLETKLAEAHMTRTENRDPHATYNKMTIDDLSGKAKDCFPFVSYFAGSTAKTVDDLGDINVRNTAALEKAAVVAAETDPDTLRGYLHWHAVRSCAPYLSKAFVDENFDFYERILSGTQEIKPRWKRAMAFTETALGEALGKLYCAEYFDEECKERAVRIVEAVRQSLEDRLKEVDWMKSDETRQEALKKMNRFRVKIGYPNKWIDYSTLTFEEGDSFLSMVFKSRAFEHRRTVKEMNAPTDREKWFMTPQTVNAYYHPSLNEIVFPAAILQHPFFDKNADDAVNFGAMGAVVGHEMTVRMNKASTDEQFPYFVKVVLTFCLLLNHVARV
jgi:putative endopeptidase